MSRFRPFALVIAAVLWCPSSAVPQPIGYSITDVGNLGGSTIVGEGLNSSGQVVGFGSPPATGGTTSPLAFSYAGGRLTILPTFGGNAGQAYAINDAGQIVGQAADSGGSYSAFIYSAASGIQSLPAFSGGSATPLAINRSGQAVGYSTSSIEGFEDAVRWTNRQIADLGRPTGYSITIAAGISGSGNVAVRAITSSNQSRAFVWSNGSYSALGTLGGTQSQPYAMNDAGDVVGWALNSAGIREPVLWHNGLAALLTTPPSLQVSVASALNDNGAIVGYSQSAAAIWNGSSWTDLNTLIDPSAGWQLGQTFGINDAGQILLQGQIGSGPQHTLLLTPVPEPGTLALTGMAAIGWVTFWCRRWQSHAPLANLSA